ncbi:MAG: glycosyltransferase [Pseudomonadota bacterium]
MTDFMFAAHAVHLNDGEAVSTITERSAGTFDISGRGSDANGVTREALPEYIMDLAIRGLITDMDDAVALHAGAVQLCDRAVLIAGPTGAGKSTTTAWLSSVGCGYLTDELVVLRQLNGQHMIDAFHRPLNLRRDVVDVLRAHGAFDDDWEQLACDGKVMVRVTEPVAPPPCQVGALMFPRFNPAFQSAYLHPVSPSEAALQLLGTNLNGRNLADGGLGDLTRLVNDVPSFELRYGGVEQLDEDILDAFEGAIATTLSGKRWYEAHRHFSAPEQSLQPETPPEPVHSPTIATPAVPATTPKGKRRLLTIGMATYDDFDGVYFSIQALRINNKQLLDDIEFIVVDNNPTGPCAQALKDLEQSIEGYRYIPYVGQSGTAVRDHVFAEAAGGFVLCMDCHVLLEDGALQKLLDYIRADLECEDLLQGPIVYDDLKTYATHFDPEWRMGMYGYWGTDERGKLPEGEPFDIPMQGLGLFVCRREIWPGFNGRLRGFGGEEGYIHEKIRARGGRTLCLPFLRWVHRFPRPMGINYPLKWEDRIRNYMIAFREVGLDDASVVTHFSEHVGEEVTVKTVEAVNAELSNPFNRFDSIRFLNSDEAQEKQARMQERLARIGIDRLVHRFPLLAADEADQGNDDVARAISHRAIIEQAQRQRLRHVLIIEDDVVFRKDVLDQMGRATANLETDEWDVILFGGASRGDASPGSQRLTRHTRSGVTAYHSSVFQQLLDALPKEAGAMKTILENAGSLEAFVAQQVKTVSSASPALVVCEDEFANTGQANLSEFAI